MADPIEIFPIDSQIQTPPTEAIEDEIGGGKKVDPSIVPFNPSIVLRKCAYRYNKDQPGLHTYKFADQISEEYTNIFKVNVGLRESNPAAYTPICLSIGPYHYKSPKLRSMEKYKHLYLKRFLSRKEGIDKESCMRELDRLKGIALRCYDDTENLDEDIVDNFSEIMLLDGCFVVEFIRERFGIRPRGEHEQLVINKAWMMVQVCRDMVLIENQLPIIVLDKLYDMTKLPNEESFLYMLRHSLLNVFPKKTYIPKSIIDGNNPRGFRHLLDLVQVFSLTSEMMNFRQRRVASKKKGFCNINIVFGKILQGMNRSKENLNLWSCMHIPSATELYEAGVSFTKIGSVEEDPMDITTLLDIKFENGVLEIPCFAVEDSTESVLRNLIAYEQHSSKVKTYFSDYAWIMSRLINSHKGAKLLRESGIIFNGLGDDKAVASVFNRLGDGVQLSRGFYYNEECIKIIKHCEKPWNKMKANLRHNYFQSPWAGASTVGAIILLILTTIQTVLAFTGGFSLFSK